MSAMSTACCRSTNSSEVAPFSIRLALVGGFILFAGCVAVQAATCNSVGGHFEGRRVEAVRQVIIKGRTLAISGTFNGERMSARTLSCRKLAKGVWCEAQFGPVNVAIITNGRRMMETVRSKVTNRELAGIAYVCDAAVK